MSRIQTYFRLCQPVSLPCSSACDSSFTARLSVAKETNSPPSANLHNGRPSWADMPTPTSGVPLLNSRTRKRPPNATRFAVVIAATFAQKTRRAKSNICRNARHTLPRRTRKPTSSRSGNSRMELQLSQTWPLAPVKSSADNSPIQTYRSNGGVPIPASAPAIPSPLLRRKLSRCQRSCHL